MRKLLLTLVGVLVAVGAGAQNTTDWTDFFNTGQANNTLNPGGCIQYTWGAAVPTSKFIFVGGLSLTLQLEPDATGADTGATVDLHACSRLTSGVLGCKPYRWDTDGDGIVDDNTFDFADPMKQGISGVRIPGWLYLEPLTAGTGGETGVLSVCADQV